jgi:hypothetical protein
LNIGLRKKNWFLIFAILKATKMLTTDSTILRCMDYDPVGLAVFLSRCNETNLNQKWEWGLVNRTMTDNWVNYGMKLMP